MKTYKLFLTSIFIILLLTSCQKQEKLLGSWERYGDRYAGLTVQVVKEGESFKAAIIFSPDSCKLNGFVNGDIKWKNIKNTTENKYEFEDLAKRQLIFTDKFEPSYTLANLELVSEDEIYIRLFSKGLEDIGTEQKWKRTTKK